MFPDLAMRRLNVIVIALVAVFGQSSSHGADKLIGLHSAPAVSQSLPWIAREAGVLENIILISIWSIFRRLLLLPQL